MITWNFSLNLLIDPILVATFFLFYTQISFGMFYIHENAWAHALSLTGMIFGRIKTVLLGYWQKYYWVTFTFKHNFAKILRENPWRKPTPHTTIVHTPGCHTMNVKGENKRDERHRIIIYTADCIFRLTKNSIKYQNTLAQSQKLLAFGRLCAIQFNSFASSFFCTAACPVGIIVRWRVN